MATTKEKLDEFRGTLEADRCYVVKENKNYGKVFPRDMSYADLQELSDKKVKFGEASLLEGSHYVSGHSFLGG